MSTPTLEQQTSTSQTNPGVYQYPLYEERAAHLPVDREGQLIGVTKLRQARGLEYRQTVFDANAANAAITLTGDMIVGGSVKVQNAGVGAVVVNLPTAIDLAIALGAYYPISPGGPSVTQPTAPSNNAPGNWKREIQFYLENVSGQNLTITSSATITQDGASGSATVATGSRVIVAIRSSVDGAGVPANIRYTWLRV
jgi:hypothetical protein